MCAHVNASHLGDRGFLAPNGDPILWTRTKSLKHEAHHLATATGTYVAIYVDNCTTFWKITSTHHNDCSNCTLQNSTYNENTRRH